MFTRPQDGRDGRAWNCSRRCAASIPTSCPSSSRASPRIASVGRDDEAWAPSTTCRSRSRRTSWPRWPARPGDRRQPLLREPRRAGAGQRRPVRVRRHRGRERRRCRRCIATSRKVARDVRRTVLIIGESGTGKELVARAIHQPEPAEARAVLRRRLRGAAGDAARERALRPREGLVHRRARATSAGIFEVAQRRHGVPRRDRQRGRRGAGQAAALHPGARVPAAWAAPSPGTSTSAWCSPTNRDLEKMVRAGTFREDLYYRLYVFPIQLPPLRERREDIPLLACHLLAKSRVRCAKHVARFSEDALKLLGQHDWPGNVRAARGLRGASR
ncbi:MAG: sigma 54-interacting transcriptional regulator [Ignavibacteriales bacterium]|nr:sigma 54-interacting transcriptional regulator [Ignavibacteriales bacterium]